MPETTVWRRSPRRGYDEVAHIPRVIVDLKYASTDNFTGRKLYPRSFPCLLHPLAAGKLRKASWLLSRQKPGLQFLVFDALRPLSAQKKLWAHVAGTLQQKYVADPRKGSVHNYGLALDIGLVDEKGVLLDMGTSFDGFTPLSEPRRERNYLASGRLTRKQVSNRRILRRAMTGAGFLQHPLEWWHYDSLERGKIDGHFPVVT